MTMTSPKTPSGARAGPPCWNRVSQMQNSEKNARTAPTIFSARPPRCGWRTLVVFALCPHAAGIIQTLCGLGLCFIVGIRTWNGPVQMVCLPSLRTAGGSSAGAVKTRKRLRRSGAESSPPVCCAAAARDISRSRREWCRRCRTGITFCRSADMLLIGLTR